MEKNYVEIQGGQVTPVAPSWGRPWPGSAEGAYSAPLDSLAGLKWAALQQAGTEKGREGTTSTEEREEVMPLYNQ